MAGEASGLVRDARAKARVTWGSVRPGPRRFPSVRPRPPASGTGRSPVLPMMNPNPNPKPEASEAISRWSSVATPPVTITAMNASRMGCQPYHHFIPTNHAVHLPQPSLPHRVLDEEPGTGHRRIVANVPPRIPRSKMGTGYFYLSVTNAPRLQNQAVDIVVGHLDGAEVGLRGIGPHAEIARPHFCLC